MQIFTSWKRRWPWILSATYIIGKLYDWLLNPIVQLNVENWATSKGIDKELVNGGSNIIPLINIILGKLLYAVNFIFGFLGSSLFLGFVIGSIVFSLWDPISATIKRRNQERLPHPSLRPTNGMHPAILSLKPEGGFGFSRQENYGVQQWYILPNGVERVWIIIFFERKTGIENIEVTNLQGERIFRKIVFSNNRSLVVETSKRISNEGLRIVCCDIGDTREVARGVFLKPQLPPYNEERK